ncbi:MAG: hypothetical protein M3Y06_00565 [Actinomycetota bacterium]|nr:hypothetical protein [Actinomycetota bacterium]
MTATVLSFDAAPDLAPMFARAVLAARHTSSSVPDVTARRLGVPVDPDTVIDYAHLCGFTVGAHPPMPWPHLLGFPLQAAVMSRRDFPVALVGLVHLQNSIAWTRPLAYGETVDVHVHPERLRPHRRGRLVDLVTEVTVDAHDMVWRGVSTYLARGQGDESVTEPGPPDITTLRDQQGGPRLPFGEDAGRRYAAVSGDVNPIHLHALTARPLGFPRAIAHGMFTYARVLADIGTRVPTSGTSTVWFRQPVTLPSTVLLKVAPDHRLAAVLPAKGDGEHLVVTL